MKKVEANKPHEKNQTNLALIEDHTEWLPGKKGRLLEKYMVYI